MNIPLGVHPAEKTKGWFVLKASCSRSRHQYGEAAMLRVPNPYTRQKAVIKKYRIRVQVASRPAPTMPHGIGVATSSCRDVVYLGGSCRGRHESSVLSPTRGGERPPTAWRRSHGLGRGLGMVVFLRHHHA